MSRNKKTSESLFQFMNLLIALLLNLCCPPFLGNGGKRQPYLYLRYQRGIGASFRNHHANLSQFYQKLRSR